MKEEFGDMRPCLEETVLVQRTYSYSAAVPFRSRKTVVEAGLQKFCRRAQVHLSSGTIDLDVENSVFSMMYQLIKKLSIRPPPPDSVCQTLRQCAEERDHVCQEILKTTQAGVSV